MKTPVRTLVFDAGKTLYPAVDGMLSGIPGVELRLARNVNDLMLSLDEFRPHVIVFNGRLSSFESLTSLALTKRKKPDIPYILFYDPDNLVREIKSVESGTNLPAINLLADELEKLFKTIQESDDEQAPRAQRDAPRGTETEEFKLAISQFEESIEHRDRIIDSLDSLVIQADLDGRVFYCNVSALEEAGLSLEQAILKPVDEVFHILYHQVPQTEVKNILFAGGYWRGEVYLKNDSRGQARFDMTAQLLKTITGEPIGILYLLRKKDAPSFTGYQNIVETLHTGICVLDAGSKIIFANDMFGKMIGFGADELIALELTPMFIQEHREAFRKKCAEVLEFVEPQTGIELEITHKNGINRVYCDLALSFLRIDERDHLLIASRDITEVKLRQMFADAKTPATELTKTISELQTFHSHDFLTNLNAIMGFADILREKSKDAIGEGHNLYSYASQIYDSGRKLLSLVDEKPTQPEAIPEPEPDDFEQSIDLEALLFECSDNAAALAKQKKVQINILTLTKTHTIGSLKSLRHVVESLFEGALTKLHGGSINIDSGFDALKHLLFVRFKITGKWHTDDLLRLLTDTESAGSNPAWNEIKYLATAKRRLEMMKARLDIHSGKGSGTVITIYLQPDDKTRETYEPKSSIFYTVSPELIYLNDLYPHLLIIEDDPGSSKMLEITLKPISKLELAQNGHDAIAMVESFFARGIILDLVLLDIGLPEPWDGITLRKHFIEQFPSYRRVPFIAETAFVGRQEKERIIESGFDGFISKPIDRRFLIKTLASTLKRARGDNGS